MALADLSARRRLGHAGLPAGAALRRWAGTLATAATGGPAAALDARGTPRRPTPADRLSGHPLTLTRSPRPAAGRGRADRHDRRRLRGQRRADPRVGRRAEKRRRGPRPLSRARRLRLPAARSRRARVVRRARRRGPPTGSPGPRARRPGSSASLAANRGATGRRVFNAAVAARRGRRVAIYRKRLLPTYDVFDEGRYVEPGDRAPRAASSAAGASAVTICEDIWNDKTFWKRPLYPTDPVAELKRVGARPARQHLGLALHPRKEPAAPPDDGADRAPHAACPSCTATSSAATTASSSTAPRRRSTRAAGWSAPARRFEEDFWTIDVPGGRGPVRAGGRRRSRACAGRSCSRFPTTRASAASGRAVLGLSGGIDSAVTAALAVEALGRRPRPRRRDARALLLGGKPARREGSRRAPRDPASRSIPIGPVFDAYRATLRPALGTEEAVADRGEPPGAHPRGDPHGALQPLRAPRPLDRATSRRSPSATARSTATWPAATPCISDVPKTMVYALAEELNRDGERIPRSTIEKPPSAELRPNQKDTDSLPPYDVARSR